MGYRSSHIKPAPGAEILPPTHVASTARRRLNAILDVLWLPVVALTPRQRVAIRGTTVPLHYEFRRWTWRSERCVEIALGRHAIQGRDPQSVLEVGNVLPLAGVSGHTVVDKYEQGPGVINEDIVDFSPGRRFEAVVSLSTLEHVGWDEEPQDPGKAAAALDVIGLLGDALLITIPVGYHRQLEQAFVAGPFDEVTLLVKASRRARWEPRPLSELADVDYGRPYANGNGILVGVRA